MKLKTGVVSALLVLCAATSLWSGSSTQYSSGYGDARRGGSCAPRCAPVQQSCAPRCEPACPTPCGNARRDNFNSTYVDNCGVRVTAKQPQLCMQGENYLLDIEVLANRDVCEVDINAMLPEGITFVRSEPEGIVSDGKQIKWSIDGMRQGECKKTRVTLRADREGEMCVCFCVTAVPVQFCAVLCARPVLTCEKCGPLEVCPGEAINYCISVTNQGSCNAEDVVVVDNLPPQVKHSSGQNTLTFKLGTLCPCETKKVNFCVTACERGKACNTALVSACNAPQTSCQFCTCICCCECNVTKTGPKEVKIGGTATYDIVVTNPGDKVLTDIVICDTAPQPTSIVEAKGATVNGNQAAWRFKELKPGEKISTQITLTACTPGYFVNRVNVSNCQGCPCNAEFGTRWKGVPALNAQVVSENPICVGEPVTYSIRVVNQGSEEDKNVSVTVRFPKEVQPTSVSGATTGQINGSTVTFQPIAAFGPRQVAEFRVDGVGRQPGDGRIKVELSSDALKTPLVQEESTIVN